jgi:outer membrane lipoprotein-sorting protein
MKNALKASIVAMIAATLPLFAQIQTAKQFLEKVSAVYSTINDYECSLNISTARGMTMAASLIYKAPNLLRVDFSQPASATIVYDGAKMLVYVPETATILNQDVTNGTGVAIVGSREGLRVLAQRYAVSYLSSPNPEAMEAGSSIQVVKLRFTRTTAAEGFREIHLMVDPETLLIRRAVGYAITGEIFTFDFLNTRINNGIGDIRFVYDPPSANVFNNFLFSN